MSAIPQYTTTTLETANERDLYIVVLSQISASNDYNDPVHQSLSSSRSEDWIRLNQIVGRDDNGGNREEFLQKVEVCLTSLFRSIL